MTVTATTAASLSIKGALVTGATATATAPSPTTFPEARRVALPDDITLEVFEEGTGPAVVLCHGFPETAWSWRHQLPALSRAGFRAVAPNQRGYGGSSAPRTVTAYDIKKLSGDLAHLLDALEIERAIFVGHDWGGFVAWAMPLLHPERVLGIVGVNTPYAPFPTTEVLARAFPEPERLYILWFQKPGVAERVLDAQVRLVFEKLMRRGAPRDVSAGLRALGDANPFRRLPEMKPAGAVLLSEAELDVYEAAFRKSGFFGPVSWYRNIDRNAELVPQIGVQKISVPCLQFTAAWDAALPPQLADAMPALCSDLERVDIPACGHWTQQEKPSELNAALTSWLTRKFL